MNFLSLDSTDPKTLVLYFDNESSLNAMNEGMAEEFPVLINEIKNNHKNARALILTGKGKAFSAGGDLQMLLNKTKLSKDENKRRMLNFYGSFLSIRELEIPVIAAINGAAVGAGLCLACACDIRIASQNSKFGFTFTKLGLHPGMGATYFVRKVLGESFASELLLTGRIISPEEALQKNLISAIHPGDELIVQAKRIASEISSSAPLATSQLLKNLRGEILNKEESLSHEASMQSENYAGSEFLEGVTAVIEKRKPSWA